MTEVNAKLSPSAAERWMTCPGSVVLSEGMPNRGSAYAEEGTQAHDLAERILKSHRGDTIAHNNREMWDHVQVYATYVQDLYAEGDILAVEKQIKVTDQVWGTADALVWNEAKAELHVVDLKYGAGVAVEVSNNLQLKIYALAALLTMKLPAKTVVATIVQPRLPHPDGLIRSKEYAAVDLLDFHADLMDAVKRVDGAWEFKSATPVEPRLWEAEYLTPSEKGCRWCLAAPTCPKLKAQSTALAKKVFAPAMAYDPAELADVLDKLPLLEAWCKNVREFAYAEAEQGRVPPGYKLVEKRTTRKWRNEQEAADALMDTDLDREDLYERKMLSPAAVEKLLGKKNAGILDELCTKESSGHTLVHETDKREAVRLDAQSAFA